MTVLQAADLFAQARGLALSARRRGLTSAEASGAMVRVLPHQLADQPELLQVLLRLLRSPACIRLMADTSSEHQARARQELLASERLAELADLVPLQQAFVDGLLQGWHGDAASTREPDLRGCLFGLGVGVAIGAGLSWLALLGWRLPQSVPQRLVSAGSPLESPLAPGVANGLKTCSKLAPPEQELQRLAAASNFGKRLPSDAGGAAIPASPSLIVVHETVVDLPTSIALFQHQHPDDVAQASYHVLIARDGERLRIVPDRARAFGAGDSAFGDLRFKTSATNPPSINNIALHVSLESPADGRGDGTAHSGYTPAQYRALAEQVLHWQAFYGIPMERVTTHAAVDRSHSRYDPRSFRWERFDQAYGQARRRCA